jgi:alpha-L-rhamnosidase
VDWDGTARSLGVEMFDLDTLELISPVKVLKNYSGGVYMVYSYNKSIWFIIYQIRGANATMSGIFFDSRELS